MIFDIAKIGKVCYTLFNFMEESLYQKIIESLKVTAQAAGFGEPKNLPEVIGSLIGIVL